MFYLIYRITNTVNGKFYIGMHKTSDIDDGYMGSGRILHAAYKKHGKHNFKKDILFIFDNMSDMVSKEIELVTEELVKSDICYNVRVGGIGGFNKEYLDKVYTKEMRKAAGKTAGKIVVEKKLGFHDPKYDHLKPSWRAKGGHHIPHTEETKDKIRQKTYEQFKNEHPTQGRCWITNPLLKKNKMVLPYEKDEFLKNGWLLGACFSYKKENNA